MIGTDLNKSGASERWLQVNADGPVTVLAGLDPEVRAAIEARDCFLIHLPAYSPDFAPIETVFSKVKAKLRQVAARTQDALTTCYHIAFVR
jgi:transposase